MKKRTAFISLAALALSSCSSLKQDSSITFSWLTPTGAPTLAFFDQGDNASWVSASNPSEIIVPSFAANSYDGIVFDGISGLNLMSKNPSAANYKLARWINNLGFYVVSKKHTKEEALTWNPSWTVDSFVETGNASRCLLSLSKSVWRWGDLQNLGTVNFETGVDAVVTALASDGYDFYLLADPAYTNLKSKLGDKLNLIYDLQEEWGKAHDGMKIPSAALFISTKGYSQNKDAYDDFLKETDDRLYTLVNQPEKAQKSLEEYQNSDPSHVVSGNLYKFGVATSIVANLANLQKSNALGFCLDEKGEKAKKTADAFSSAFGGSEYSSELFLN